MASWYGLKRCDFSPIKWCTQRVFKGTQRLLGLRERDKFGLRRRQGGQLGIEHSNAILRAKGFGLPGLIGGATGELMLLGSRMQAMQGNLQLR